MQKSGKEESNRLMPLSEVCRRFSVSEATAENWIRSGRLEVEKTNGTQKMVTAESVRRTLARLRREDGLLQSRRNKTMRGGKLPSEKYLPKDSLNRGVLRELLRMLSGEDLGEGQIRQILALCAEKLVQDAAADDPDCPGRCRPWIRELKGSYANEAIPEGLQPAGREIGLPVFRRDEDTLGFLYQAMQDLRLRRRRGAYYTPAAMAESLVQDCGFTGQENCVLDPACGSGQFLIRLPRSIPFSAICGRDLDELSVLLTRLNLALRYPEASEEALRRQIRCGDSLKEPLPDADCILGNPPWGAAAEDDGCAEHFAGLTGTDVEALPLPGGRGRSELAALFLAKVLGSARDGTQIAFLLPESLLTVRAHGWIREWILRLSRIRSVIYLGNGFEGVTCPAVRLHLIRSTAGPRTLGMRVTAGRESFTAGRERAITADSFYVHMRDPEWELQEVLTAPERKRAFRKHARFALGIVTGRNREVLSDTPEEGAFPILRGTDIYRFGIEPPSCWLRLSAGALQQMAPEELYRAEEKLIYRFVSRTPVFARDTQGYLTLNSANILLPEVPGLPAAAAELLLNSAVFAFLYERGYRSVKLLRQHIEAFPLPEFTASESAQLTELAMRLERESDLTQRERQYTEADRFVAELYGLTDAQTDLLQNRTLGGSLIPGPSHRLDAPGMHV